MKTYSYFLTFIVTRRYLYFWRRTKIHNCISVARERFVTASHFQTLEHDLGYKLYQDTGIKAVNVRVTYFHLLKEDIASDADEQFFNKST